MSKVQPTMSDGESGKGMATDKAGESEVLGCLLGLWSLIVTGPMRLVLLWAILESVNVPAWAWFLYWAYVPAVMLGIILSGFARVLVK